MKKEKAAYIVVPFISIIFAFFLMNILAPDRISSISENRNLEKKPTVKELKSGDYPVKFESYYNDQFIFREEMISANRVIEVLLGKSVVGNYYLTRDNWILGKFPAVIEKEKMEVYAESINYLASLSEMTGKRPHFIMTPHKTNVLKHLYPEFVEDRDSIEANKSQFKELLDLKKISFIDGDDYMLDNFNEKKLESLYFKTDHHWNGNGAFEYFKLLMSELELGIDEDKLNEHFSSYKMKDHGEKPFIGSYNKNLNMIVSEEEYPISFYLENQKYEYFQVAGGKETRLEEEEVISTQRDRENWDYGGAYIRGNVCNMLKIKNENALADKRVLVFRDSYQAPMTLMFADVFQEVVFVDPRNIENIDMTYEEIIRKSNSDIVMFLYNSSGFDSMIDTMIAKGIK